MEEYKKLKLDTILSSDNLAEEFTADQLDSIGQEVVEEYKEDKQSRVGWESAQEESMQLALQVAEDKTYPWPGAANIKYPLLTTAAIQFSSRAYSALVPGTALVKGKVTGYDSTGEKAAKAERIGKHMSYQLLEQMEDWEEEMDKLCVSLPILGTMFKKTYYDTVLKRNVSELVYPRDLVVNYWAKTLETAPRLHHVIRMSENEVYERVKEGIYVDWGEDLTKERIQDSELPTDNNGTMPPNEVDESYPYTIIETHCYWDFDQDGYAEPYIITVHANSGKVLRIVARFDEDGVETKNGEVLRIKPIHYFTKFSFVPDPDGSFYDIGFGTLLGPINETINTLINQLVDAGTLSNMQSGFISKGIRIKGGNKSFEPGEWKFVNSTGDDLRKGLVPLPVREPSNVLFQLLGMMVESGEKLASVTDMLLGENPGQNQPATTTMTVLEQGMKVFTSIYKRVYRSLKKEYKKLFYLNSIYLDEEEYFRILDEGQEQMATIGKGDYDVSTADVQPAADPNIASESMRMVKARALIELIQLGLSPQEVAKRNLEAMDIPNIPALFPPPPTGPGLEERKVMVSEESNKLKAQELQLQAKETDAKVDRLRTQGILDLVKAAAEQAGIPIEQARVMLDVVGSRYQADRPKETPKKA